MKVEVTIRVVGQSYKDKLKFESSPRCDNNIWLIVDGKRYNVYAGAIIQAVETCTHKVYLPN